MNRAYGFKRNSKGHLYTADYLYEVARGLIPGHTIINKFGYNSVIDTDTYPEDVWAGGGSYNFFPLTAKTMVANSTSSEDAGTEVSSGTATGGSLTTLDDSGADFVTDGVQAGDVVINDTNGEYGIITAVAATQLTHTTMSNASQITPRSTANASGASYRVGSNAGNGAGVIHFLGLDSNWDLNSETVIMNGQTDVALQNSYIRQHRAFVVSAADEDNANLGAIQTEDDADATAIGTFIGPGCGQTEQTIMSIPRGKTGYFLQGYVGMSTGFTQSQWAGFTWRARTFGGCFRTNGRVACASNGSGWWQYSYKGAPKLPEYSDVKITCVYTSANGSAVVGGIDMLLIDNDAR